ncbi:MAG: M42 family metallopeptidase [Chloroflexi bacterium]|nr:M42 family metallopeptidase [Chloroflexota bacterium]
MALQDTLLKQLSESAGVSGAENEIRQLIYDAIKDHVTDLRVDTMGNLLAVKKGTGKSSLKVMVAAHMDEVGFMVMGVDSDGLIKFSSVGGIDPRILPALRVHVGKDKTPGVITWKPIHLSWKEKDVKKTDSFRIDIGAENKAAAEGKAQPGDRVTFASETIALTENIVRGKAFDDRAGCAELIELIKGDPFPFDLLVAFTVQEEIGSRGAQIAAQGLKPDVAIVLEATAAHEVPQSDDEPDITTVTKLGHGPVITYMDKGSIAHPGLRKLFVRVAEQLGIPHQFRSPQYAGGTDAAVIHVANAGVATITISVPCRYLHSPYLMLDLNDFQNVVKLVRTTLMQLSPSDLER